MSSATIFISYRHGEPSTRIADGLYTALSAVSDGMDFELVMDAHEIAPSDRFDQRILDGLNRTTHFLALLDNQYWASDYCHKELAHAVNRFEKGEDVRLLFVMAGAILPKYLTFDKDRASGRINSPDPLIKRIGDLQFLGPFDEARRLERLSYENPAKLDDQFHELIRQLERVLPKLPRDKT
jgi:hypothetical protein